jgi:type IV pilus assembly protein PilX
MMKIYQCNREQGVVLIVALIMVLIMAMAGMAAIRGSGLQEMMAGSMRDLNVRFQTAEAGLRYAESHVDFYVPFSQLPNFTANTSGFYQNLNLTGGTRSPVSTWTNDNWTTASWAAVASPAGWPADVANTRYVIEEVIIPVSLEAASTGSCLDQSCLDALEEGRVFRVSSYHTGNGASTNVFVQSLYKH